MNCVNCGAALPARSDVCTYCQTRNDTDLRRFDVVAGEESGRVCPRCKEAMPTVAMKLGGGAINIERCSDCLGIFFDRFELEAVLKKSLVGVTEVDYQRLAALAEERKLQEFSVGYVMCPVCSEPMYRRAYGKRSGIVVNTCKDHGLWLDGGALGSLLRWSKLGGMELGNDGAGGTWDDPDAPEPIDAAVAGQGAEGQARPPEAGDTGDASDQAERRSPADALRSLDAAPRSGSGGEVLRMVEDAITDVLSLLDCLVRS